MANGLFAAVGQCGAILSSRDGVAWVKRDSQINKSLKSIVYENGAFTAQGCGEAVVSSTDGLNWRVK
jgi:hypothetical protein